MIEINGTYLGKFFVKPKGKKKPFYLHEVLHKNGFKSEVVGISDYGGTPLEYEMKEEVSIPVSYNIYVNSSGAAQIQFLADNWEGYQKDNGGKSGNKQVNDDIPF